MTKQKTRKELEVALKVTTTIMLIFAVVSVGIVYMWYAYMVDSEQQLSECQEQAPVWTLKVKYQSTNLTNPSQCTFNRWCSVYWDSYQFKKEFNNHQDYENALRDFKEMCKEKYIQNCVVLK